MHLSIFVARVYIDLMKFREVAQGVECTESNTLFLLIPIPSRDPVDVSCGRVGLSRLETRGAAVAGIC